MPIGTLDRQPPPFFRHGPSAWSKLMFFGALAVFLMVADARFQVVVPMRSALATALFPVQWLALQPVRWAHAAGGYFDTLHEAQRMGSEARQQLAAQSLQANQVDGLLQENARLRELLSLQQRTGASAQAAEVLYDAADSYTRKIVVGRGSTHGVVVSAAVVDANGVLGQVTRVHPFLSEVTLLVDRDQAIPVLNARTGARSVAYGDPLAGESGGLELRFTQASADVKEGDLLTTSGVDGVYPPGLPVARIARIERRADSPFARIDCTPLAQIGAARHVMVLAPFNAQLPPRPQPEPAVPARPAARKAPKP